MQFRLNHTIRKKGNKENQEVDSTPIPHHLNSWFQQHTTTQHTQQLVRLNSYRLLRNERPSKRLRGSCVKLLADRSL